MIANVARWRTSVPGFLHLAAVSLAATLVVLGHLAALARPAAQASPLVIASHLFAVLLAAGLLILAVGLGATLLSALGLAQSSRPAWWLFSTGVGLGVIAYAVLGVGLAGMLRPAMIAGVLVGLAIVGRRQAAELIGQLPTLFRALLTARRALRSHDRVLALAIPIADLLAMILVAQALAPPSGYDALMYHLMGPRRFLEAGRMLPLPDLQQANMPMTIDLLYLIGLAFGSVELATVLHLAMALLTATALFAFARSFVNDRVAWMAPIIFLSTSLIWLYGPNANIDYGLALFDFLAIFAVASWVREREPRWLVVAGVLGGLCLGTKYFGATTAGALGLFVVARAAMQRRRWADVLGPAFAYGLPALLVAAPWYVKNWLWLGTPVWPFLRADPQDLNILISPNMKYGTGLLDFLLLPYYVYVQGSLEYAVGKPPLLLLVLPLYLLLPRHRVVSALLLLAAVQVVLWTQMAQVVRYLTPTLPELCIGAAYVADRLGQRPGVERLWRPIVSASVVLGLALTLVGALDNVRREEPFAQLVGLESQQDFLVRMLPNQRLIGYLNDQGDAVQGVLLIGDRRAFFLRAPSWVDVSLGAFASLATALTPDDARAYLARIGVSHVLVSEPDLAWHARYDPEGHVREWWVRFQATNAAYLEPEATSPGLTLYRVRAPGTVPARGTPIALD